MRRHTSRRGWSSVLLTATWLLFFPVAARASEASIAGRVIDDNGAALSGATVEAYGTTLSADRLAVTDRSGAYAFPGLPTGIYKLSFRLASFAGVTRRDVVLLSDEAQRVDVVPRTARLLVQHAF